MAQENFVHKTLDKLLEVIEVELKLPLGIADVKLKPTAIAKEWRENKKKRTELENAIQRAEEKFTADHKDKKVAQMLHELPLYSEEEFKQVIAGLLTHLDEKKISWLAEIQLTKTWGKITNAEEIRKTLELYIPYLRHELNGIKEFRDVISVLTLERIDENTQETVERVRRIESDLKELLKSRVATKAEEPDFWYIPHPYPMPPNFTGRAAEQKTLDDWLADDKDRLFILRALGGFGKSALTWQWINTHVNPAEWTKLVWWSFYEGDASFEHFIEETLKYLKLDVPQGQRPQVDELLKAMQSQKILLIMDGFERALRAYSSMNAAYQGDEPKIEDNHLDCVNINAEIFLKSVCSLPNIKSKVLMTTRLTPRAIKPRGEFMLGCREEELTAMQKVDAVEFFHKQKIKGTHAEIEAACAPYGYHPLSLRLLAGRILKDFENPADIVVAQKLKIDGDIIQQKHHVLEVSYNSLPPHEQNLLSTIACFRSHVELKTLEAITENQISLNDDLRDLTERGMLHFDEKSKRFDLHPIMRRYTYEQIPERKTIHRRLVQHYKEITKIEPKPHPPFNAHWIFIDSSLINWHPREAQNLDDIALFIELYHHIVQAGELEDAYLLMENLIQTLVIYIGDNQTAIGLLNSFFPNGRDKLPQLESEISKWDVINLLVQAYIHIGQPRSALHYFPALHTLLKNPFLDPVIALLQSNTLISLGSIRVAQTILQRQIKTTDEFTGFNKQVESDSSKNATGNLKLVLGYLLSLCGDWKAAKVELSNQQLIIGEEGTEKQLGFDKNFLLWVYRAQWALLMGRDNLHSPADNQKLAIHCAQNALDVAEKPRGVFRQALSIVRARWLLGAAYRSYGNLQKSEESLSEAITQCHTINNIEYEANILLDLARLRYDQKKYEEAKSLAEEALTITERCGYVLQGADVNLFLAQYALEQEKDKAKAKEYAETALKLAYCDGPPYYYKVAYEEAERMLEGL